MLQYEATPGTRLRLQGAYHDARFFVIDVYDAKGNPYRPNFLDLLLDPDPGSGNPFRDPAAEDGTWTAYVEFDPPRDPAESNTIFAGSTVAGDQPNTGGTMALRVYLPRDPQDPSGGVPLPSVTIEDRRTGAELPLRPCPTPDENPFQPVLDAAVTDTPWPGAAPFPLAQNPPVWSASTNPDLDRTLAAAIPPAEQAPATGVGLLTTPDNSYLSTRISREHGQLFVFRAKAPTSPDTRGGQWVGSPAQLRYWSVCQFSTTTNMSLGCLSDHEVVRDDNAYFTVVISHPDDRPANADNWLPFGAYEGWPYYRQFRPAETFHESVEAAAASGLPLDKAMGSYFPEAGYCSTEVYESGGWQACLRASADAPEATPPGRGAAPGSPQPPEPTAEPTAALPATGLGSGGLGLLLLLGSRGAALLTGRRGGRRGRLQRRTGRCEPTAGGRRR